MSMGDNYSKVIVPDLAAGTNSQKLDADEVNYPILLHITLIPIAYTLNNGRRMNRFPT